MIRTLAEFLDDLVALLRHKSSYRVANAYEMGRRDAYLDVIDYLDAQRQRHERGEGR